MFKTVKNLIIAAGLSVASLSANATIIEISNMSNPSVTIDFGTFATGSTSLAAINAAAPGAGILSMMFSATSGSGTYDTDLGSGNALARDGSGLTIVSELSSFQNSTDLTIVLDHYVTQFGFQLADRTSSTLEFLDGAVVVGSILTPDIETPPVTDYFESDIAFNTIRITQSINWVIPELVIQTGSNAPVPAPASIALLGLGIAGLAFRKHRA